MLSPLLALALCGALGEAELQQLTRVVAEGSRPEVDQAINKITYANAGRAMTPRLAEILTRGSEQARANAAYALGHVGDARAAAALSQALADGDVSVRMATAVACGRLKLKDAGPALVKALGDRASAVRREAVRALGLSGYRKGARALTASFKDEDLEVRAAALLAAGLLGNASVAPAVRDATKDPSEAIRRSATRALAMLGDEDARAAIGEQVRATEPGQRREAVGLLAEVRQPWAANLLVSALEDASPEVRLAAARALGRQGDDRGVVYLVVTSATAPAEERAQLELVLEELRVSPEMRRAALAAAAKKAAK